MVNILLVELEKLLRQRRMLAVAAGLAFFVLLLQLGFRFQDKNPLVSIARKAELDVDLVLNAINTTRMIVNACYYLFFPLLTVMIFADQIAGERGSGTLRVLLSRPLSRGQLYVAKFLVSIKALTLMMLYFTGMTLFVGVLFFGVHEFLASGLVFDLLKQEGTEILSFSQGMWRLFLTAILLSYLLLPAGALSLYCSVLCRSGLGAMAASLVVFFAVFVLQGIGQTGWLKFFSELRPFLFTTPMEAWKYVFSPQIEWNEILPRAVVSTVYTICFFVAGLIQFRYQDQKE